jgi:hypothetical protein
MFTLGVGVAVFAITAAVFSVASKDFWRVFAYGEAVLVFLGLLWRRVNRMPYVRPFWAYTGGWSIVVFGLLLADIPGLVVAAFGGSLVAATYRRRRRVAEPQYPATA